MSTTALVFAYPNGSQPAFIMRDVHVYSYPEQDLTYWVNGEFWYAYPDGKEPVFFRKDDYLYDYPQSGDAKYLIRAGKLA